MKVCFFRCLLSSFYCADHLSGRYVKAVFSNPPLESQAQSRTNYRVSPWPGPCLFAFPCGYVIPFQIE